MPQYSVRKRSFREVSRFSATDQAGVAHTVVERVATLHDVGASGRVVDVERGLSCFYSATSGDAVARQADGSFESFDGRIRLRAIPQTAPASELT